MFILAAIPIGILLGLILGGSVAGLTELRLRWVPLLLLGLLAQLAIFSAPFDSLAGEGGPAIYVASTALVLAAVVRNIAVPGMWLVALGAGCNLAAIVANGGFMPADASAIASIGGLGPGYSNSVVLEDPALRPLTDIFAMPAWLPFANVFSIGDVLLGLGIAAVIALAMRRGARAGAAGSDRSAADVAT